jgi:hypothetical protein
MSGDTGVHIYRRRSPSPTSEKSTGAAKITSNHSNQNKIKWAEIAFGAITFVALSILGIPYIHAPYGISATLASIPSIAKHSLEGLSCLYVAATIIAEYKKAKIYDESIQMVDEAKKITGNRESSSYDERTEPSYNFHTRAFH